MNCPKCNEPLSEHEVRSLHGKLAASKRKTHGGTRKLTDKQREAIRASRETQKRLAKRYKVSQVTISRVKRGV